MLNCMLQWRARVNFEHKIRNQNLTEISNVQENNFLEGVGAYVDRLVEMCSLP